jgi:hypothetical protein
MIISLQCLLRFANGVANTRSTVLVFPIAHWAAAARRVYIYICIYVYIYIYIYIYYGPDRMRKDHQVALCSVFIIFKYTRTETLNRAGKMRLGWSCSYLRA